METLALRPGAAAQAIGISRSKLYELIAGGEIRAIKCGTATIIPIDELRRWLNRQGESNASL